jgi:hypothetical protein
LQTGSEMNTEAIKEAEMLLEEGISLLSAENANA